MKENVLQFLNSVGQMRGPLHGHLYTILTPRHYPKGTEIVARGAVCREIFFLSSGMVVGLKWQKGKEVTTWIMREGDVVTSPESFFAQTASTERLIAVEDCTGWGITWVELEDTYAQFPEFNRHGRILTQGYYVRNLQHADFIKTYRGKEKYKIFLETNPELVARCPQKYLASYLNVNVTTLSTLRSNFKKRR
jgi:CRP/FNR family transcriptional regulator, anaerobic regulatory protein